MPAIRRVCVYCGSSAGDKPAYGEAAADLGRRLAAAGIGLVYGGGSRGLMGMAAGAALAAGGEVIGIIPDHLRAKEVAHAGLSELLVVATMHERKRLMAERSDAFAILPGGIGTLDETFEIVSWRQLGLHEKPVFVVDVAGYWAPLRALLDQLAAHGFANSPVPRLLRVVPDVTTLMTALAAGETPPEETHSELL